MKQQAAHTLRRPAGRTAFIIACLPSGGKEKCLSPAFFLSRCPLFLGKSKKFLNFCQDGPEGFAFRAKTC